MQSVYSLVPADWARAVWYKTIFTVSYQDGFLTFSTQGVWYKVNNDQSLEGVLPSAFLHTGLEVLAPDRVLFMSQIELNFFEIELFWHLNYVLMLNWCVWNLTVFTINCV